MMSNRRYIICFISVLALFVALNAVIWFGYTRDLRTGRHPGNGDLARLGYVAGISSFAEQPPPMSRTHMEVDEYQGQPVDMVTIGDSFSNGGAAGSNCYYQDFIATYSNLTVLNKEAYKDIDFISQVSLLLNSGYLEKIRPRYLLLSTTAKYCIERCAASVDFNRTLSIADLARYKPFGFRHESDAESATGKDTVFAFINDGNLKYVLYSLYYKFSDHAFFSKTFKKRLDTHFFSGNLPDTLLFFRDDILNLPFTTPKTVAKVNSNLNQLADHLAAKGIQLVFMPVVDKYDLYYDHILHNTYPANRFFDLLRPLPKRYRFIDTKAHLAPEIAAGRKDVFYVDDTHWTWKAPELIFRTERFK